MDKQRIFTQGIYYNFPREGAPEFVLGSLSIKKEQFMPWLDHMQPDENGYIRIDMLRGKEGKPYLQLNTYKK